MHQQVLGQADIQNARNRLHGQAVKTPLLWSAALNERLGGKVFLKAENLQRTGTFKFRGAYNAISSLSESVRKNGVVACSSGNHAQGVAEAARIFGIPATIVMPSDAPQIKLSRTRASGAEVITYDRDTQDHLAIARAICEEQDGQFVHPYDDTNVMAGQATVGAEILAEADELGLDIDDILVCCGGGGLASGIALAVHNQKPDIKIHTVEPEGFDDHIKSFAAGTRKPNERRGGSVCDALLAHMPGELTFEVTRNHISSGFAVSDQEALQAVRFAWMELKLVLEPGGAVTLAALLSGKFDVAGKTVVAVLSGGNIDPEIFSRAMVS